MAHYLYQLTYNSEAIKAMIAKPTNRREAAKKLVEAAGGKLHALYFAYGKYDVICLIEAPDDKTMVAAAAAVAATGAFTSASTTKLISAEDAMEAMAMAGRLSQSYVPPTG